MTLSVIRVLLTPRNPPATTTPTMSTVLSSVQTPIAVSTRAKPVSATTMPATVPIRRCTHGAMNTEATARKRPHPKKTRPVPCADRSSGKGVKASSVKKPTL